MTFAELEHKLNAILLAIVDVNQLDQPRVIAEDLVHIFISFIFVSTYSAQVMLAIGKRKPNMCHPSRTVEPAKGKSHACSEDISGASLVLSKSLHQIQNRLVWGMLLYAS